MEKTNQVMYRLGLVFFAVGLLVIVLKVCGIFDITTLSYPCLFHRLSGLYCPGCGGTRAARALMEGRLLDSLIQNPIVLYTVGIYLVFMLSQTWARIVRHVKKAATENRAALKFGKAKLRSANDGLSYKIKKESSHRILSAKGLDFKLSFVYIGVLLILLHWMLRNILLLLGFTGAAP